MAEPQVEQQGQSQTVDQSQWEPEGSPIAASNNSNPVNTNTGSPSSGNYNQSEWEADGTPFNPDDKPGFWQRVGEQSGVTPIYKLLTSEGASRVASYHAMVDAAKSGDWKQAAAHAEALTSMEGGKKDPIYEAAKSILMQPIDEMKAARQNELEAQKAAATGDIGGLRSERAQALQHSVTAIPLVGGAARNFADTLVNDVRNKEYLAAAGDITGFLSTLAVGKGLGEAAEQGLTASEGAEESVKGARIGGPVRPSTVDIAGVNVPVSTPQMQEQGLTSRILTKIGATRENAQSFIDKNIQPAAQKAVQQNFVNSALKTVDRLRSLRGAPLATEEAPVLNDLDSISKFLTDEAHETYKTLDTGSDRDLQAYNKEVEKIQQEHQEKADAYKQADRDSGGFKGPKPQPPVEPELPEKPKAFSELQEDRRKALDTLASDSKGADTKASAISTLNETEKSMDDFVKRHSDLVSEDEYKAANRARYQASQYEYLAKKIRSATSGTDGLMSDLKEKSLTLNPNSLARIPAQFDNTWNRIGNAQSFAKLLGPEGLNNFHRVISALRNPINGNTLADFLTHNSTGRFGGAVALGAGLATNAPTTTGAILAAIPTKWVINKLLFDPEFGSGVLKAYNKAASIGSKLWKDTSGEAALPIKNTGNLRKIMQGAAGPLGAGKE